MQPTKFKTLLEIYSHGIKLDVLTIFFMIETKKEQKLYSNHPPNILRLNGLVFSSSFEVDVRIPCAEF